MRPFPLKKHPFFLIPLPVTTPASPSVLLIDDHSVFRMGIRKILEQKLNIQVCAEARDHASGLRELRAHRPDLAIVDLGLPGADGLELIKSMLAEQPNLAILVISMHDENVYAFRALRAGARGYLPKSLSLEHMAEAVSKVLSGGIYVTAELSDFVLERSIHGSFRVPAGPLETLSDRELEVLRHIGAKHPTRVIAEHLHVSIKTIETHRAHLKAKLGVSDAADLQAFASRWLDEELSGGSTRAVAHLMAPIPPPTGI